MNFEKDYYKLRKDSEIDDSEITPGFNDFIFIENYWNFIVEKLQITDMTYTMH